MITTAMIDNGIAPTVAKDLIILLYDNTEDPIVPLPTERFVGGPSTETSVGTLM